MKSRVSEIRVKRIRVNQGVGVILTIDFFFSASCFPQRCKACYGINGGNSGRGAIANYDCVAQCGLCALCDGNINSNRVPECDRYCGSSGVSGEQTCENNCSKGKRICLACSGYCGI